MNTAQHLVDAAQASMPARIDRERAAIRFGDWSSPESGYRYIEVLRGLTFWANDDHTVVAMAPDNPDSDIWGYTAGEVLDSVAAGIELGDDAKIDQTSRYTWELTW